MAESDASRLDDWVEVRDGIRLSISIWLPDGALGPQPCVLEALPYRKDDVTSGYRPSTSAWVDDSATSLHAWTFAARAAPRAGPQTSTPSRSSGPRRRDRVDRCSALVRRKRRHVRDVVQRLQLAADGAERPPALKAVLSIYGSDDRYTDDVRWMGGASTGWTSSTTATT